MSTTPTAEASKSSLRTGVQKFGTFLSMMIMPNIAAIIAWGLITAFFIPDVTPVTTVLAPVCTQSGTLPSIRAEFLAR